MKPMRFAGLMLVSFVFHAQPILAYEVETHAKASEAAGRASVAVKTPQFVGIEKPDLL